MIDSDSDALSGVGSDEEARPLNTAEEQAAKRAKLPVVNPFDLMQERRMSSHRTSATSGETEGPAAEEPEEQAPHRRLRRQSQRQVDRGLLDTRRARSARRGS